MLYSVDKFRTLNNQIAALINGARYTEIDGLDTHNLARVILDDDLQAWLRDMTPRLDLVLDDCHAKICETVNKGIAQALKLPEATQMFIVTPSYGMTHKPTTAAGLERMWSNTHVFTVTDTGIAYVGQVSPEQMQAVSGANKE